MDGMFTLNENDDTWDLVLINDGTTELNVISYQVVGNRICNDDYVEGMPQG